MTDIPYQGPGIWIRVKHRFGPRMMEWFMAGRTALWGAVVLYSDDLATQPTWSGFRAIVGNPSILGWLMVVLGVLRFGGLIVNGARKHVTPTIRQVSAGIGFLIWLGIAYGFASSGIIAPWLAIYPIFAIEELVNCYRAAHDQGEARNARGS